MMMSLTKAVPDVWEVFTDNFYYLPISDDMEKFIMEKIMFEVFNVPVMYVAIQALLPGVVMDSGACTPS